MKDKQGNLSGIGLPRLLNLVHKKADPVAALDIIREPVKKRFFFKDGMPVAATSNVLGEVLGRLLMQEGIISQQDYERSLELVLKDKKKHGQVLISMGLITEQDLDLFLRLQLKRRLWNIFTWNEGSYRYTKTVSLPQGAARLPLNPASLILEGISLGFYPLSRIRGELEPHLDSPAPLNPGHGGYDIEDLRLNLQERRFLESFDDKKTVKEVIEGSDLLRQRALSLALGFLISGIIKPQDAPEERCEEFFGEEIREAEVVESGMDSKLNAELLFMRAKSALEKKDYQGAIEILKGITDLNPMEGEYWAYLGWATYKDDPAKIKEAEKILKDAIDLNNDLDSAWYFLGVIFLASGRKEWARKCLRNSLAKNPWMLESLAELKRLEANGSISEVDPDRKKYMDFYGFDEDPFTALIEPGYLSPSASASAAVDTLAKGVRKKSGPMLLEGAAGCGKTTVLLELLKALSGEKVLASFILKPADGELKFIKEINAGAGVYSESASVKEQLLSLGMRVSQNKIQGGHTVIVIDRAHLLTPGCLRLVQYLSRLKTLQIVLAAEPDFSQRLKDPEFNELDRKILVRASLPPLSAQQTEAFIHARLKAVRKKEPPAADQIVLSDEASEAVFEESSGIPSAINAVSARLLSRAAEAHAYILDRQFAESALRGAGGQGHGVPDFSGPEPYETKGAPGDPTTPDAPAEPVQPAGTHEEKPEAKGAGPSVTEPYSSPAASDQAPAVTDRARRKKSPIRIFLVIILLIAAGIVAGSLIGTYFFGGGVEIDGLPASPENQSKKAVDVKDTALPAEGSIEGISIDASIDSSAGL